MFHIASTDVDGDYINEDVELAIANKFSPVLIKSSSENIVHPELQQGLGNFDITLNNYSKLKQMNSLGQTWEYQNVPNAHKWIGGGFCSYGKETPWETLWYWLEFTFASVSAAHVGAPTGQRPLYYHVYKENSYFYVQYWYYFNCNDIRGQTNNDTWHEGDWEHFTIKLSYNNGVFTPVKTALYQHHGGSVFYPPSGTWSNSNTNISDLRGGYVSSHTHPLIFVASNSHASYFQNDLVYKFVLDAPTGYFDEDFVDEVDYYIEGGVDFFTYDNLEKLGECRNTNYYYFHNTNYLMHTKPSQNSKEWLGFPGRCGRWWNMQPGGLWETSLWYVFITAYNVSTIPPVGYLLDYFNVKEVSDIQTLAQTPSPFQPFFGMHYYYFPDIIGRFGNDSRSGVTISWVNPGQ